MGFPAGEELIQRERDTSRNLRSNQTAKFQTGNDATAHGGSDSRRGPWFPHLDARTSSLSSRSTVFVKSCFNSVLNSPLAGAANPACTPRTRPSRPRKKVVGQAFRFSACLRRGTQILDWELRVQFSALKSWTRASSLHSNPGRNELPRSAAECEWGRLLPPLLHSNPGQSFAEVMSRV